MYAKNAIKNDWLEDVVIFFFGPVEKLMVEDKEIAEKIEGIVDEGECYACKAISEREEITEEITDLGVKAEFVGSLISDFIREGYIPMVW